jgi:hypothetical protein
MGSLYGDNGGITPPPPSVSLPYRGCFDGFGGDNPKHKIFRKIFGKFFGKMTFPSFLYIILPLSYFFILKHDPLFYFILNM